MANETKEKVIGVEPVYDANGKLIGTAKFIVPQERYYNAMVLADNRVRGNGKENADLVSITIHE